MATEENLIVSEMIRSLQTENETYKEAKVRVANEPKLLTKIYRQVYNNFSSEKSLKKYILNKL